jgi:hypothetical protein
LIQSSFEYRGSLHKKLEELAQAATEPEIKIKEKLLTLQRLK